MIIRNLPEMRGGVAIVLPVYNAEEYITDCLDSILAQTYPYWKAYCINDGSKDNTASILDDYAKKDARIRVFHTPNAGAASARNFALNKIEDENGFIHRRSDVVICIYE